MSYGVDNGLLMWRLPRFTRDGCLNTVYAFRAIAWRLVMDVNASVARRKKNNGHAASASESGPQLNLNQLLDVLRAMQAGNFSVRLPGSQVGGAGKICDAFNTIIAANQRIAQQPQQVGEVVGRQGKTPPRVRFGLPAGARAALELAV